MTPAYECLYCGTKFTPDWRWSAQELVCPNCKDTNLRIVRGSDEDYNTDVFGYNYTPKQKKRL